MINIKNLVVFGFIITILSVYINIYVLFILCNVPKYFYFSMLSFVLQIGLTCLFLALTIFYTVKIYKDNKIAQPTLAFLDQDKFSLQWSDEDI